MLVLLIVANSFSTNAFLHFRETLKICEKFSFHEYFHFYEKEIDHKNFQFHKQKYSRKYFHRIQTFGKKKYVICPFSFR